MPEQYSILLQKMNPDSEIKDSFRDFGVVCLNEDYGTREIKSLPKRSWVGLDGDDEFIPAKLPMEAFELKIHIGYRGSKGTWRNDMDRFLDYLSGYDGKGSELKVYFMRSGTGYPCRLKSARPTPFFGGSEDITDVEIVFKVNNPRSKIKYIPGSMDEADKLIEEKE